MRASLRIVVAVVAVAASFLVACAGGAKIALPLPDSDSRAEVSHLFGTPLVPARVIPRSGMVAVMNRIDQRIQPAAAEVCRRTFNNPQDCPFLSRRTITVYPNSLEINAFIDENLNVGVLGGLVSRTGCDDEIALVLAHEYAHALFGHVAKTSENSMWGELIAAMAGVGVMGAVAKSGGTLTDWQIDDLAYDGVALGGDNGGTVFSKGMELEDDHLAMFILTEAGYDLNQGMKFFQRAYTIQLRQNAAGHGHVLGFFRTHRSDEERLLNLLSTKKMIEQGARRPIWKQ